jgi:hypothetical protein
MHRRSRTGFLVVVAALLAVSQAAPAAAAGTRFGSRLDNTIQPSNAEQGQWCDEPNDTPPHPTCTWILNEAYVHSATINPLAHARAPRDGYIDKIRIISCIAESFRLQVAKVKRATQQARVVRQSALLSYAGDANCGDDDVYTVKTINLSPNLRVFKGQFLAIRTKRTGMLRCSSGGPHTYLFDPPLVVGGVFRTATDTDGCWILLEAVMS